MAGNETSSMYEVGFGKPPKRMRFAKGVSGNPKGRPRGKRNLATVLEQVLQEKTTINDDGVNRTVTKLEAAIKQLINKATSGELKALQLLTALARSVEEHAAQSPVPNNAFEEADKKVVLGIMKRLETITRGPQ